MAIRLPRLLQKGDTVALLGPASPLENDGEVDRAASAVAAFDLRVKEYPSARKHFDYLAGSDSQRAGDLQRAFADERVRGIICIRGGYGSSRLLPMLDWDAIARTPKLFLGFSDITSLHGALNTKARLAGLHGPMASYFLKDDEASVVSRAALEKFLFESWRGYSYRKLCGKYFKPRTVVKGKASGVLVGGNLSLFAGLAGTPWLPKPRGGILFIEEIHEKPYKLDRFVTQLVNAGYFKHISGVVIGQIDDCVPSAPDLDDGLTVLSRCLKPLRIPVLAGLPVGHGRPAFPLPIGVKVELDATGGDLRII